MFDEKWEANRRAFLKFGVGAVLLSSGVGACGGSAPKSSATLTIGVAGDPETLDPERGQTLRANETIKNIYGQWVRYQTYDTGQGYVRADLKKPVVGEALESVSLRDGGKTVYCRVRRATLPSGRPLTADDFTYKVGRSLGEASTSVFDFNLLGIKSPTQVEKVNAQEFVMHLPHASPILGPMLRDQDASILDMSIVKQHATPSDPWASKWVSLHGAPTGAYLIASWTPGSQLVLKSNPHYWGPRPYFETVILQEIPSPDDRVLLLKKGSIDIAEELSSDAATRLKGASGVNVLSIPSINQDTLGFVLNKPPFNDVRLRQAIAYAIPYGQLAATVLRGEALLPKGVWPRNSVWFENAPWPYDYNPVRAKAMLADAGHKNGFSFTLELSQTDADAQALAVPVKSALSNIGVTMNISQLAPSVFNQHLTQLSMQAWLVSNNGSYVDDPYYQCSLWYKTKAVLNSFSYSSPVVDKITTQLASALTPNEKSRLALEAQQQLNHDLPVISLGEPNFLLPIRDDISDFLYEPDALVTYRTMRRKA
jgi:peptide/nickel transport system substrate-binding protein